MSRTSFAPRSLGGAGLGSGARQTQTHNGFAWIIAMQVLAVMIVGPHFMLVQPHAGGQPDMRRRLLPRRRHCAAAPPEVPGPPAHIASGGGSGHRAAPGAHQTPHLAHLLLLSQPLPSRAT